MKTAYFVRDNLVVRLSESKTYQPGERVELTEEEYQLHAHQVETEAQYQARNQPSKESKK
jgi:hypothetical protein